ncbi:MAG: acyltransferase family protein, partial [Steroidobacteraceae bacterium]
MLAVILFHADFLQCRGGFVGVDVFFVISGFLITSIIVAELDRGTFSLAHFYERRVRRIFPALFLMMAVCCVAGALLFDPSDLRYLGESVAATSLFASNILFWIQTGYFNSPADDRPLLHTWSLAVEEQFYVFFPLYLIITSKFFPRQRTNLTLALCGLSFVASAVAVRYQPDTAFYLAPMRAWELLLGALLALGPAPRAASAALRNLGTTLGVVMVLVACFSYSGSTSFPGVAALLPTVGTALIIWAGMEASPQANSLLGCRPLVFVGKISYSLYLWHFMLLGFVRYLSVGHPSVTQRLVAVLVAFALSCISWRYVEQLFRKRVGGFSSRTIAISGVAVTVVFLLLGAAAYWSAGFPARLHGAALAAANGAIDFDPYRNRCYMPSVEDARTDALCKIGAAGDMPVSFVLWGDSHAEAISSPLSRAAAAVGRRGVLATQAACPPLLGVGRPLLICEKYNDAVFDLIRRTGSITDVILESRWAAWSEGKWFQEDKLPILLQWHGT